jgi:hypothetical protein
MRRQYQLKGRPNLWKYSLYEAALLLAVILVVLFLLPELGKYLQP